MGRAAAPRKDQVAAEGGDALEYRLDELALAIVRETGAIRPKGELEIRETVALFRQSAGMLVEAHGVLLPTTRPGRLSYAKREPHGVVGVVSPFNFPLVLGARAVAPALAAGNTVVLKPDPRTPLTGGVILARAIEEAGFPDGVFHMVPGGADIGQALVEHPATRLIAFTGSTAAAPLMSRRRRPERSMVSMPTIRRIPGARSGVSSKATRCLPNSFRR